jgi:DNA-binding transcriptional MerR regulator
MPQASYSISELASDFDISTRTIRFYEEKGLLDPERKGQTRIYSAADRIKLKLIVRGKRLGLSLEESKDIIEMYQPEHDNSPQLIKLIDKIRERQRLLKEQLRDIKAMLGDLDEAEARCVQALTEMKGK